MQASPGTIYDRIGALAVHREIAPDDWMLPAQAARRHYFYVGCSNLLSIYNLVTLRGAYYQRPEALADILDFGCGFGRVTRWLRAAFPKARIHAADLRPAAVEWCARHYGAQAVPAGLPEGQYDLVWVGSVFTHLPEAAARTLLAQLLRSLRPRGMLAITTHGRSRIERLKAYQWGPEEKPRATFRLNRAQVGQIVGMYEKQGYGYVDYARQEGYGLCVAPGQWYAQAALASPEYTQILFQEKPDNAQDLSAFLRQDVARDTWGRLWDVAGAIAAADGAPEQAAAAREEEPAQEM